MIVRKLRSRKNWSQEQLADFSGLSVRTIQRVEKGQKASLETLKCIAAVFEVDISTLTEEITVIDKTSKNWIELPWWFKTNMYGISTRRQLVVMEYFALIGAFAHWILFPNIRDTPALFLFAYCMSRLVSYADKKQIWFR